MFRYNNLFKAKRTKTIMLDHWTIKTPKYEYKEKGVTTHGGTHKACFPKNHTNVDGVILNCFNLNAGDSYANITRNQLEVYLLEKGKNNWEKHYVGLASQYNGELNVRNGLFQFLFSLEDKSFQRDFTKKAKISGLEKEIESKQTELEKLKSE
jgi:hypothetical protein